MRKNPLIVEKTKKLEFIDSLDLEKMDDENEFVKKVFDEIPSGFWRSWPIIYRHRTLFKVLWNSLLKYFFVVISWESIWLHHSPN